MKKLTFILIFVISTICVNAQIINFPDVNFKAKLLEATPENYIAKNASNEYFKVDANNNGEIEIIEAENVFYLDINNHDNVTGLTNTATAISSLIGIEYFVNITNLNCSENQLTSLNINTLANLTNLNCSNNLLTTFTIANPLTLIELDYSVNQIPNLNVNQFLNLESLTCAVNQIQNLNLNNLTLLRTLECSNNLLTALNVNNLINLEYLSCGSNQLTNLDLTSNLNLIQIYCANNALTSLVLPNNPDVLVTTRVLNCSHNLLTNLTITKMTSVLCSNNLLTTINFLYPEFISRLDCKNNNFISLDLSSLTRSHIGQVDVSNNTNLLYLNIKNGKYNIYPDSINNIYGLFFNGCHNLQFICIDDLPYEISYVQSLINNYGYTNCQVNSYCTFVPGGIFYTVQGQQKFDNESDGCDTNDSVFPNFKYSITNGTTTGTIVSNNSGNYSINAQAGTYTISPILENPSYFIVSPTNVLVSFPAQTSPIIQDFCIAPNGTKHDVEVSIVPVSVARPGFDTTYKIIYKNKGNQTENGVINLQFDDTILDEVSTNPAFSAQTLNNLSFNYSNLNPFETREILVVLNLNSPVESPAVNVGDILNYTATITQLGSDEMLSDNTFVLNQTVVNSFDPNEKTCLEGNYVSPDKIGEFVHYMIHFENTGTFPAENIVVKDMIDTTKFDVSSLVPLHSSHNYVTKISGNKVEFIFENINLPFDDANNDGYIAFKIKTLPSLVVGNTFSNSANIYFDYNFPIVTNTATTTIAALNNPSFEFANYFSLYPNPTTNELNINLKSAIEINSIQIYNTIGQLVTVQTGNALKVDVSQLKTGNYFIKINANEGFGTSQFIKE